MWEPRKKKNVIESAYTHPIMIIYLEAVIQELKLLFEALWLFRIS